MRSLATCLAVGRLSSVSRWAPEFALLKWLLIIIITTAPILQQIVPFEEWMPRSRTVVALPSGTTFQRTKSQKNWLLKTHAEAFLGNMGLPGLISEHSRAYDAGDGGSPVGPVLAVGEIADSRNTKSSRTPAWPVVAMAAGEAGHVLRILSIQPEIWSWNNYSLSAGAPQSSFQGSWCHDGSPILQIQFATKLKQYDNIRWLIVQKGASTTILEPELTAKSVTTDAVVVPGQDAVIADHIAMNSVVTLTADATGGQDHCDFSINLGLDEDAPQLAIMDRSGKCSVWYIMRDGHGRSKTAKAVLRKKGVWNLPIHVPIEAISPGQAPRVAWTSLSNSTDDWERDSNHSEGSDLPARALHSPYVKCVGASYSRYDGLLLGTSTQIQVQDANGHKPSSSLNFVGRDGKDILLDTQPFSGSPSHVFVLTTEKVYLLDVTKKEDQEAKPPNILVSCYHSRHHHRESLRMSVSKLQASHDQVCNLVLVHSTHGFRMNLFWFTVSQRDGAARFHHQVLQLPGVDTSNAEGSQGIESVVLLPLQLSTSEGKRLPDAEEDGTGHAHSDTKIQFYQLFSLATDLSLSTSIVAIVFGASQEVVRPIRMNIVGWDDARWGKFLRRKQLTEREQGFVVPDEISGNKQPSVISASNHVESYKAVQLRYYFLMLMEEINRGILEEVAGDAADVKVSEPFPTVQEIAQKWKQDDVVSLRPLLAFSNLWQPVNLSEFEDLCSVKLRRLKKSGEIQSFRCGIYGGGLSVVDVFERISINWSARLPAEALKSVQWKYMELALERMAAEVFLSEQGAYMVPRSTLDLASKALPREEDDRVTLDEAWDGLTSSQPRSSLNLPTPSATPSSSRAASEAVDSAKNDGEDGESGQEDPAVTRLRMYLPSIKFTPPPKNGPSRILSLWPEQRGVDPAEYMYTPPGRNADAEVEAAKRRREKEQERRRRRAEIKSQLGIKMEGTGASFSQAAPPTIFRSSPVPQEIGSSQAHSQGFGFGFGSQSQNFSQDIGGFGHLQTMSQPLPGGYGARSSRSKKKPKIKPKPIGFR